jgi:hypothetical protein
MFFLFCFHYYFLLFCSYYFFCFEFFLFQFCTCSHFPRQAKPPRNSWTSVVELPEFDIPSKDFYTVGLTHSKVPKTFYYNQGKSIVYSCPSQVTFCLKLFQLFLKNNCLKKPTDSLNVVGRIFVLNHIKNW